MAAALDKFIPVCFANLFESDTLISATGFQTVPVKRADLPILDHQLACFAAAILKLVEKLVRQLADHFQLSRHGFFVLKEMKLELFFLQVGKFFRIPFPLDGFTGELQKPPGLESSQG